MNATTTAPAATEQATERYPLTNTCLCVWCEECDCAFNDSADDGGCPEDGSHTVEPLDCGGDCYQEDLEALHAALAAWLEANPGTECVEVRGTGIGWRRRDGYQVVAADPAAITDAIAVDSEWRQVWELPCAGYPADPALLAGAVVGAVQSHHDSMGEGYTFRTHTDPQDEVEDRLYTEYFGE